MTGDKFFPCRTPLKCGENADVLSWVDIRDFISLYMLFIKFKHFPLTM